MSHPRKRDPWQVRERSRWHGRVKLVGTVLLLVAGEAGGTVMESWSRSSLQFTNLGRAEAVATATALASVTTSSTTSAHLSTLTGPTASLPLVTSIPVTDPGAAPITSVLFSEFRGCAAIRSGAFGNISGGIASSVVGILPNRLPTNGGMTICLLVGTQPPCSAQLNLTFGATSAGVHIGGGVGGVVTIGGTGSIRISIVGAPYTVKTVSAVNRTAGGGFEVFSESGFAHGPASLTSSTAATSGVVQFVTASHTTVVGPGGGDRSGSISRTLTHFVPEPGLLLLFGSGAAGVALMGRRRASRERRRREEQAGRELREVAVPLHHVVTSR